MNDAATATDGFARRVLAWSDRHGRRHLPWQRQPTPYRVWVSEIMLQQTQVATVVPYFERFMASFADVETLAGAPVVDTVLHHWSGLGYYARGRNLHRAAAVIVERHGGELPADLEALTALPGIGRSTAGAILALGHGRRAAILDGNVKRVLARFHAVDGWPGVTGVAKALWAHAETHTPDQRVGEYTQAMMDLGATVCLRTPLCGQCPLAADCRALRDDRVGELPGRKPRKTRPRRETVFLLLRDRQGRLLLERRPPAGIWGGLWGFPECAPESDIGEECRRRFGIAPCAAPSTLPTLQHGFTHFDLDIAPLLVEIDERSEAVMEGAQALWYNPLDPAPLGLAAPVARLIGDLAAAPGDSE